MKKAPAFAAGAFFMPNFPSGTNKKGAGFVILSGRVLN
jgi:hypothetical protein